MEKLSVIQKEIGDDFNKEKLGQEFKQILYKNLEHYNKVKSTMEMVGGKGFSEVGKNIFILKNSLKDFSKILPEKQSHMLQINLINLDQYDPLANRLEYHISDDIDNKNEIAKIHNEKFEIYKTSIRALFETLKEILPGDMVLELWARNSMFIDLLGWADNSHES